jgi:hypothetical protein
VSDRLTAHAEAAALRLWAEGAGVFAQGRAPRPAPAEPFAPEAMFSAAGVAALAAKPITAVGVAASGRAPPRLFVYTRRRLTRLERRALGDNGLTTPIEFRVAGAFGLGGPVAAARRAVIRPDGRLPCGSSIGIGNAREAGTLGAILADAAGVLHGLSCNHVTGGCSNARRGLPVVAPGILDVAADAAPPRTLGFHARALPLVPGDPSSVALWRENTDAAAFRIADPDSVSSRQGNAFDTPTAVAEPEEDATVAKVGRSTGLTSGIVESRIVGPQRIDYALTVHHSAEESVAFRGAVFFEPVYVVRGGAEGFATEGDSGALVVERDRTGAAIAAVGLVIGGRAGEETLIVPLAPILDRLGMRLVGGLG